jgi:hypothetical protein
MPVNLDAGYTDDAWDFGDWEVPVSADSYTIDYDYSDFDFSDGAWDPDYDSVFDDTGGYDWDMGDYEVPVTADNYSASGLYEDSGDVNFAAGGGLLEKPTFGGRPETPAEKGKSGTGSKDEDDFWDSLLDIFKNPAVLSAIVGGTGAAIKSRAADKQAEALLKGKSQDLDWQREKFYSEMDYRRGRDAVGDAHHAGELARENARNAGLAGGSRTRRTRRFVKK